MRKLLNFFTGLNRSRVAVNGFNGLMDDTGSAKSLARSVSVWLGPERAIISVVLCCALLTYGGVSAFVVAFAIIPVAAALFRTADIPKRLMPGANSM